MTDYQEQLILKFLNDTISPEEQKALRVWINESEANKKLMDDFTLMWKVSKDQTKLPDFESSDEWQKFERSINRPEAVPSITMAVNSRVYVLKIAASISVIVLFSWILYLIVFSQEPILKESRETIVQVVLPDGSKVWLNRHSRLAYDDTYNSEERIVKLLGEAFFEVRKDAERAFIILTNDAQVRVLGTSFNVQAYERTNATEVFVASGLVSFSSIKNKSAGITLNPGERGSLLKTSDTVVLSSQENSNVLSWKERRLIFNKSTIDSVVENIENYFGIDIEIRNKNILRCRFTGSFNEPTLSEVIEALSISLDLTISKADNVYVVDGQGC
jgi:transmembrane sensor